MFIYSNLLNLVNLVYLNLIFSYKRFFLKRKVVVFSMLSKDKPKKTFFLLKIVLKKK